MKAVFFAINLFIGIIGVTVGIAALVSMLSATHTYTAALVGVGALALAGICLCFCGDCLCSRRRDLV